MTCSGCNNLQYLCYCPVTIDPTNIKLRLEKGEATMSQLKDHANIREWIKDQDLSKAAKEMYKDDKLLPLDEKIESNCKDQEIKELVQNINKKSQELDEGFKEIEKLGMEIAFKE